MAAATLSTAAESPPRAIAVDPATGMPGPEVVVPPSDPATPGWVVSSSGQFRVSGNDSQLQGTVAMLAEQAKSDLLAITTEKDAWSVPVLVRLHGRPGDPQPLRSSAMKLLILEGKPYLQVDLHLARGLEHERLKWEVTSALMYERALSNPQVLTSEVPLRVPVWLVEGLRETAAWRAGQSDRRLYETLFQHGGWFRMEDLLGADADAREQFDGASRAAFRASCGALVMALIEQPEGLTGLKAFLAEVASHQGELPALLRKHFPGLSLSETSLAKWWALQMAAKGGNNLLTEILSVAQTEAALTQALQLHLRDAEGISRNVPLTSWEQLVPLSQAERAEAVRPAQDALIRLSYRCFPSYRSLLRDYQAMLAAWVRKPSAEAAKQIEPLARIRQTMTERATRGRDYLDWFEITRAREISGEFEDYLKLKDRLKSPPKQKSDPVSDYLDRMDRIFHRPEPGR